MIYKKSHGIGWLLKKIGSNTLTWRIILFVQSVYYYITDLSYISDSLYSKDFAEMLHQYLHINIKRDWIGRLYGIINPSIDIDGNIDFNNTIIEIDGDYTNSTEYVKVWIYRQFHLIDKLFKTSKMYDYINVDIKHVGPIAHDNYLVVIDVISRKEMANAFKRMMLQSLIYLLVGLFILFIIL